ncbi:MAG: DUF2442 domain-containing protein [Actinomycetota bacterium]
MRIRRQPKRPPRVTHVEVLDGYVLRLRFTDGLVRTIDVERDLWGPVFEPLRDPERFREVFVDHELGTIVWPNGADMDPDVLHGDFESVRRAPSG